MPRYVTGKTTLDHLRQEARRWLKDLRGGDAEARARLLDALPDAPDPPALRDVQRALAIEYGFPGWPLLKRRLDPDHPLRRFERVAEALVAAFATADADAMLIVWHYFGHRRAWDGMKRYVRLELGKAETALDGEDDTITVGEARYLVARAQGQASWDALASRLATVIDARTIGPGARPWEETLDAVRAERAVSFNAHGQMSDAVLERLTRIDHLYELDLGGSRAVTDDGIRHLARLPHLRRLNLSGCAITDRGLAVLRQLPHLESIVLSGTGISDGAVTHLTGCDALRAVDLSGTTTGDAAIRALAGKPQLADFRSGSAVTDDGLASLRDLPMFARWHGGDVRMWLTGYWAEPTYLMLRGPFTDAGLARLRGLDGLFALNVDSSQLSITGDALVPLMDLPHLGWLAFDANDASMPRIAALPRLRFLLCQDTTASDDGFTALSRSRTLEYIWGRRCSGLGDRGLAAMAEMPAMASMSVSLKNVSDDGLAALPRFPSLRELMPIDAPDAGYRHIGRCERLESLVLMYCRETGDVATSHLTGLRQLKKYFASYNRITDRTPELLSTIASLEEITFDTCTGLSTAGVSALARLPRLRMVSVSGSPLVTPDVVAAFPASVDVRQSP